MSRTERVFVVAFAIPRVALKAFRSFVRTSLDVLDEAESEFAEALGFAERSWTPEAMSVHLRAVHEAQRRGDPIPPTVLDPDAPLSGQQRESFSMPH